MRSTLLPARQASRGFSLIEVVVALAILGVGVLSLIQLFSGSLRTTKKSEDYSKALIYARSLMEEAYSMPDLTEVPGAFDLEEGFRATRTVSLLSSEEETTFYEISVTIRATGGHRPGGTAPHDTGIVTLGGIRAVYEKEL